MEEISSFIKILVQHLDDVMDQCVSDAAKDLGKCLYIPAIDFDIQGESERLCAIQKAWFLCTLYAE